MQITLRTSVTILVISQHFISRPRKLQQALNLLNGRTGARPAQDLY